MVTLFVAVAVLARVSLADCVGVTVTSNPYEWPNCTWDAWNKANKAGFGLPWFPGDAGNAGNWDTSAETCGFPVGSIPLAGSIAVFQPEQTIPYSYVGHVAFVEEVFDGGAYRVSECNVPLNVCPGPGRTLQQDSRTRFIYKRGELPPYPTNVSPKDDQFFYAGTLFPIEWQGANSSIEEYKIKLVVEDFRGYDGFGYPTFGPLRTYCETSWFRVAGGFNSANGACDTRNLPEGKYRLYITSRWMGSGIERAYPSRFTTFRVGVCGALASLGKLKPGSFLLVVHYCPADVATPTPNPIPTGTGVAIPTSTPRPTTVSTATNIPFQAPILKSPSDNSSFTSGDRIVLSWECYGGCAESRCIVEREGEVYNSDWTKETSWVSPINNYGDIKWKVQARKGDQVESDWSPEWTIHINSTGATPPRLISPSIGTAFSYGSEVLIRWECRSFECKADLYKNGVYFLSSGWTQNEAGWKLFPDIGCGNFAWGVRGRDTSQRVTDPSPSFSFSIGGCPANTRTRTPTNVGAQTNTMVAGTKTRTPTITVISTKLPTKTRTPTRTRTPVRTKTPTRMPTATRTKTASPTRFVIPTIPPIPTFPPWPWW